MASNGVAKDHHNLRRNLNLNDKYISNDGGDEGITIDNSGIVTTSGTISLKEQASAPTNTSGTGRLWVKNDTPTNLYFTDDDETDIQLTSGGLLALASAVKADDISTGDSAVSIGTSSGDIVFKSNGNSGTDEWLTFSTSDTTFASSGVTASGTTPTTAILSPSNQKLLIATQGTQQDLQILSRKDIQLTADIQVATSIVSVYPSVADGGGAPSANWESEADWTEIVQSGVTPSSGTAAVFSYTTNGAEGAENGSEIYISASPTDGGRAYTSVRVDNTVDGDHTDGDGKTITCDAASGSTLDFTNVTVGMAVYAGDWKEGEASIVPTLASAGVFTTVASKASSTSLELSLALSSTATNRTFYFGDILTFTDPGSSASTFKVMVMDQGNGLIKLGHVDGNSAITSNGYFDLRDSNMSLVSKNRLILRSFSDANNVIQLYADAVMDKPSGTVHTFNEGGYAGIHSGFDLRNTYWHMDGGERKFSMWAGVATAGGNLDNGSGGLEIAGSSGVGGTTITTAPATGSDAGSAYVFWDVNGYFRVNTTGTANSKIQFNPSASVQTGADLGMVEISKTTSDTTAAIIKGLEVDFQKSGTSTSNNTMYGIDIDMDNTSATNGTNKMYGIYCTPTLTHNADAGNTEVYGGKFIATGGTNGTSTTYGLDVNATGGDSNIGLQITCQDTANDTHIKLIAADDANDYATIAVADTGDMTIATVGSGTTDSDLTLDVDGNIYINADAGSIRLQDGAGAFTPTHASDATTKVYVDSVMYDLRVCNYYSTSSNLSYVPLVGYVVESLLTTGRNEYQTMVMPYDGTLKRVIWRSETEQTSGTFAFFMYITSDGTEVPATINFRTRLSGFTLAANTTYVHEIGVTQAIDSGVGNETNAFSKGQIISFGVDPTVAPNDTNCTLVFKYDTTT